MAKQWFQWNHGIEDIKQSLRKVPRKVVNIVSGMIEEVNEQTFRITELPIRKWTQDYKQFLESVTDGSPNVKDPPIEVNLRRYFITIFAISLHVFFNYETIFVCRISGRMVMMLL